MIPRAENQFVFTVSNDQHLATQLNMLQVLEAALRLLSPFAPYLSEELWQRLPKHLILENVEESVTISRYPDHETVCYAFNS